MTIDEIRQLIARDETRTLELKKTTGELKDGMHSACAMLNTDGGWLFFGIAPVSLKIQGQVVTDKTRQEIANALTGLEPAIDVRVEYVDVPEAKNGEQVIAMHFNGWVWGKHPYTYHGCPYYKPESITKVMPQEMYDERVRESDPLKFSWENKASDVSVEDLDVNRIGEVVRLGIDSGRLPSTAAGAPIVDLLKKMDLIVDGRVKNAGVMLFGKSALGYPQLLVRLARFGGKDKDSFVDNQRAKGNFFDLLDAGMAFFFKHLSLSGVINGLRREEQLEIPVKALREGLINAYCHRLYDMPGDSVSIGIYDDRVEIVNPGRLPNGWTTETIMQSHESRPRNPVIADVLYLSTYLESWGSGVKRMIEACSEAGAPEPEYRTDNGCVTVIFRRSDRQNDRQNLSVTDCESKLSERQRSILAIIANDRQISAEVIGKKLKVSTTTVYRDIKAINKVMIVYWDGPSKTGHWVMQTKCR